jgi:hypothetical protein
MLDENMEYRDARTLRAANMFGRPNQHHIDLFKPNSKQQTLFESIKLEY